MRTRITPWRRWTAGAMTLPFLLTSTGLLAAPRRTMPHKTHQADKKDERPTIQGMSPLETQVMGQNQWLRGGPAALRVIVSDHKTGKPLSKAEVAILVAPSLEGKPGGFPLSVFHGFTDTNGTLNASFKLDEKNFPAGPSELTVNVVTPLGQDQVKQPIQVAESSQMLLTVDKPIYQPNQMIHIRALALDMATRTPLGDKPVTFEVEDARGNKVFKKKETLSKFGIASADFQLADEVNMGTFTIRAVLPEAQTEKKVRVERYVLPKFKISLTPDKPFYLPGDSVKVVAVGKYFFGKPVADSEISLTINTIDIGVTKLTELKGKTDTLGQYTFRYTLPKSFVGQPFEQGKAVVEFAASLKDTADHKQESHLSVPVVKEPIQIVMVPERREMVPGVENRIYIAAATPDGQPLKNAKITALVLRTGNEGAGQDLTTDALGIAELKIAPLEARPMLRADGKEALKGQPAEPLKPLKVVVTATNSEGRTARVEQEFTRMAPGQEGIILRIDKPMAKVGDKLNLTALSSSRGGTLYLDVIRNRQTILTHAQPMQNGESRFTLPVTNDMVGTLELHAYKILPDENIIRDTRTVIATPADDLNVQVKADKVEYRPGGDAKFTFSVKDTQGRPIMAALGLAMVDESVYALSELQPGLEKIYFTLEKELMEPKYEIHGLKPTFLLEKPEPRLAVERDAPRQRAANMLLAAVPARAEFDFRVNTYAVRWEKFRNEVIEEMQRDWRKIYEAVQKYQQETKTALKADDSLTLLVDKGYLKKSDLLDRWGNYYKTNLYGRSDYAYFSIQTAGPDGRWESVDDVGDIPYGGAQFGTGRFAGRGGRPGGFGGGLGGARFRDERIDNFAVADAAMPMVGAPGPGGPQGGFNRALALRKNAVMEKADLSDAKKDQAGGGGGDAPRVREYFPETMLWLPSLITDEKGQAVYSIPMADSITTWRMSLMANSLNGSLGSNTAAVKVFQDFFVDIDLPVSLTQNDRVEIPVAVYNYLPQAQEVTLDLASEPWFELQGKEKQTVKVEAGQVKMVSYPIRVKAIGQHALTVTARGSKLSDAIKRQIEVTPDGKEFRPTINDRLEGNVEKSITLPAGAIKEANNIWVKLYPGTFSQVVEGLDGILQMPNGCFEQTSSTTYPNILVLDYLKTNKRINPELQMKAEQYINVGYQRLVTFECKKGGFSWFGDEPAHRILTAYGLLEFSDMAKVHEVDPALISRTQTWLAGLQSPDGSWDDQQNGIAEGIINRQTGKLRASSYIAWALAETGYTGPELAKGVDWIKAHRNEAKDPYTVAVILNLLTKTDREGETTAQVAGELIEMAKQNDKTAWWQSDTKTFTGAEKEGADLETTGLAAYGLVKWGRNGGFVNKVLTYLVQSKNSFGTWSSTQGTVWSMKSLLYASRNAVGGGKGNIVVLANGKQAAKFAITPEDSDVMRQVSLAEFVQEGDNKITLQYDGEGSPMYQIVGRYFLPWKQIDLPAPEFRPLSLDVKYDKTTLAQDDTATVTVTIKNTTGRIAEMPLIDVGVPPGFTVVPDNLEKAVADKTISKYTQAARQVIIYLEKLDPGQEVKLTWQVRAKFPIKARTPLSKAYPYYNPERVATVAPTDIIVNK